MNRSSIYGMKIDFERSQGSYLFDKNSDRQYLDFMGMYSTLVLGYNHSIFSSNSFKKEIDKVANIKITNCEMLSDESNQFNKEFIEFTSRGIFSNYHYNCTGALAIESAIKTAIDYKGIKTPRIISFKGSFHGVNGYGGFVTDRFVPVNKRLEGFPNFNWHKFNNPVISYKDNEPNENLAEVEKTLVEVEKSLKIGDVVGILVEPIQCTYGDAYFSKRYFIGLKDLADQYDIPLIFDEIQVGFGTAGQIWYYEHLDVIPDILVFGKKTQLSGIMVRDKFSKIFESPIRLEVTWDADLIDMIRCRYIIKAFEEYSILNNVNKMGQRLKSGLLTLNNLTNIRSCGLLLAFDFNSKNIRDKFVKLILQQGLICNPTRDITVRLRPNLGVNKKEVDHALEIIKKADDLL
ncbi:aminotransferase class III-fold pyridoxal phosphate-dependent enzyme [candidate division KSB1 bacterium]|nr:aminotransferase class III-fold pyridoxal phosphate-dependent enzyme [candidate division KSB1 bacterium]